MTIGERLKNARLHAGLTQEQLGKAVGIKAGERQRVSEWETGARTPNRENVERLAHALGVSPGWLAYGD